MNFRFTFLILCLLFMTACGGTPTAPPATVTPAPSLTPTATMTLTPQPTSTPTLTATSTPAQAADEWPLAEPVGEPLSEWHGIPIMPEAIAGEDSGKTYFYSVDEHPYDVYRYYLEQMPKWGWDLFGLGVQKADGMNIVTVETADLDEYHSALFYMGESGASTGVFFLVHPDTGRVYVMLTYN